jgi:ribosomal protein S18 acetylase RimI-like enzyme
MEDRSAEYQVRRAGPGDIGELVRMQLALQESMAQTGSKLLQLNCENADKLRAYYQEQTEHMHTRVMVAVQIDPARTVGMGTGRVWLHADYLPPRSGELIDIWVDPEHRRRGLAQRVIAPLLRFFRAHNVEFLAVNYVKGNALAGALWKKLGFEPVVVTAATDRTQAETALGMMAGRRIIPIAYESPLANKSASYAGVSASG